MLTLQQLLDAFASGGIEAVTALLADAEVALSADAVNALRNEAADAFQRLLDADSDDLDAMGVLADVIDACKTRESEMATAAAEQVARRQELATRALGIPAQPRAEDITPETPPPADDPEPVVAAAPRARVDLASIAARAPQAQPPAPQDPEVPVRRGASFVAAADVPGFSAGQELDLAGVTDAALARYSNLPTVQMPDGTHIAHQFGLVRKPELEFTVTGGSEDQDILDRVADETRLQGGSLVAAGGWCAPSEVWYDLCPGLESTAGMLNLPTAMAPRGGVRWTQGPQFCDFYAGTGFFDMTEAQDIAGFTKPCYEIPCPTFQEARLEAHGLCLTAGILQNKGYPEYVSRFISGSLTAHAHRLNAQKIKALVQGSTAITPAVDSNKLSASTGMLGALETIVTSYRYKYRMDPSRSLEMVAPIWLRGVLRHDVARKAGIPSELVSDSQIDSMLRTVGVNPQFVYDWQDAMCQTADAGISNADPDGAGALLPPTQAAMGGLWSQVKAWPSEVKVLLYPAGTFVSLEQDIITLTSVYDSALFRQNRYTALFTEEAFKVINRCFESLVLTIPVVPNGISAPNGAVITAPTV